MNGKISDCAFRFVLIFPVNIAFHNFFFFYYGHVYLSTSLKSILRKELCEESKFFLGKKKIRSSRSSASLDLFRIVCQNCDLKHGHEETETETRRIHAIDALRDILYDEEKLFVGNVTAVNYSPFDS